MPTWLEFSTDVRKSGLAKSFGDDNYLEVALPLGGGRSQTVIVRRIAQQDGEWVSLDSPFALVGPSVDVMKYLRAVSVMTCGGLECIEVGGSEWFAVRHMMPLATMDAEDFSKPLLAVARVADAMERDASPIDVDIL